MVLLPSGAYSSLRMNSIMNSDSPKSVVRTKSVLAEQVDGRETLEGFSFPECLR